MLVRDAWLRIVCRIRLTVKLRTMLSMVPAMRTWVSSFILMRLVKSRGSTLLDAERTMVMKALSEMTWLVHSDVFTVEKLYRGMMLSMLLTSGLVRFVSRTVVAAPLEVNRLRRSTMIQAVNRNGTSLVALPRVLTMMLSINLTKMYLK